MSKHFIFSTNQDSIETFFEAPDPKLTGAKVKLSMDFSVCNMEHMHCTAGCYWKLWGTEC